MAKAFTTPEPVMKSEVAGRGEPIVLVPGGLTGWLSWRPHAQRLVAPVLLFKGVGSPRYLREIIDVLGEEFPHAQVQELSGAHALHIVSMDRFLEILGDFLSGHARGH